MHECPDLRKYLLSLYDCRYDDFFVQLAKVEQAMKSDRFLNPHYAFYVREMKVRAFAQLTASYRSLTLGKRQTSHKGPYIKDVRKIFGIFDPLPPCPHFG